MNDRQRASTSFTGLFVLPAQTAVIACRNLHYTTRMLSPTLRFRVRLEQRALPSSLHRVHFALTVAR